MSLPLGDTRLVQIMDAALADVAARAGKWLACRMGCTQCCHGIFAINALDAERLRTGMDHLRIENPALSDSLLHRAQAWVSRHSADFPGDRETGILGDSELETDRFETYANDAACPALDPVSGGCDVYAWRPMTCRVFGPPVRMAGGNEIGCCELCFVGASKEEVLACEMTVPHEVEAELLDKIEASGSGAVETVVAYALLGLGKRP